MTYEVIDDYGNTLGEYDTRDIAERELAEFVDRHPDRGADLSLACLDDGGHVLELVAAGSVRAHAHQ